MLSMQAISCNESKTDNLLKLFFFISRVLLAYRHFTITIIFLKVDHNRGKREILVVLNAVHQMIIEQRQHLDNLVVKTPFGPQEVNRQPEHPVREGLH